MTDQLVVDERAARARARRDDDYEWLHLLMGRACEQCGEPHHQDELFWTHRVGEVKHFNVGSNTLTRGRPLTLAEIRKCDVLCADCRRTRNAERKAAGDV